MNITYRIEFKDCVGWYCPGEPWDNPSLILVTQWADEIEKNNRKDVRVLTFIDGKLARRLCVMR